MQEKETVYDLMWNGRVTYGDVHKKGEWELSVYSFELADVEMLLKSFDMYERESLGLSEKGIVLPAYDYCLKCSHTFNLLEARGAISVTERTQYIDRIRNLARKAAKNYLTQREEMGYPLLKNS
jgi:glycyl-tRNA synthetase alpha chain